MLVSSGDSTVVGVSVLCMLRHCLLLQGYLSTEVSAMLCMRTMLISPDVSTIDLSGNSCCFMCTVLNYLT